MFLYDLKCVLKKKPFNVCNSTHLKKSKKTRKKKSMHSLQVNWTYIKCTFLKCTVRRLYIFNWRSCWFFHINKVNRIQNKRIKVQITTANSLLNLIHFNKYFSQTLNDIFNIIVYTNFFFFFLHSVIVIDQLKNEGCAFLI